MTLHIVHTYVCWIVILSKLYHVCCSPFQEQIVVETMHLLSFARCNVREDYTYPPCGLSLKVFMPGREATDSHPSLSWQLHRHKTSEVTPSPEVFRTVSPVLVIGSMRHPQFWYSYNGAEVSNLLFCVYLVLSPYKYMLLLLCIIFL